MMAKRLEQNSMPDAAPQSAITHAARPWQFGLRRLLLLMLGACVFAGLASYTDRELLPVFGLAFVGWTVAVLIIRSITEAVVAAVIGIVLIYLVLRVSPLGAPRKAAQRSQCSGHLKQISLALLNYHDVYKSFPPAFIADQTGKPMHSWRVLILPFMEQKPLYDQYRFDEPWDGPNNRRLHAAALNMFECPAESKHGTGHTSYVAVVGPGTAWPGAKSIDLADIKDGTSNTILVVEVKNSGIHWMEPRDLDASQMPMTINAKPLGSSATLDISSGHKGVAQVAFADGSVRAIPEDTPPATLRAMLTITGGEKVDQP